MNWSLVKKDFMLLLKSPLTYIGVLSMVVILYITVSPYIKLYDDFQPDGETMEYSYDGNITDGYIPTPENERWEYVSQEMEAYLVSECEMSHEDAQKQMDEVLSKGWTVQEIRQFFIDEYGIVGFQSVWNMSAYKKADAGEVQQYLDSVFQEESYTSYLGRKYADYLGITSILFTISVFAILLMRDMRKSIYSFIHTKPISSRNYVLGKYIAGISMVLLFVVNSMFQAVAMLVSTILNAVFDPVFIHFIGFHGAAIATLLSQMICLLFMLTYLKKKKLFTFKISAFNCSDVLLLIQKAIPSVIQQSIPAISTTSLTALVSTYSVTAIAAYGVTGKLETILFYPAMALNMVLTTIIGQCAGGARYDRAKDYLKCALGYGCGLLVILSVLVVGFSKQLSGLFVRSSDVAVIVGTYFLIVSIGYVLNTVTNCYLGALNGMGKPSISMFLMIFYYIVVRMPLAYLLSYLGFGLNGIWVAVLVSHIVASLAATMTGTVLIRKKGNIKA